MTTTAAAAPTRTRRRRPLAPAWVPWLMLAPAVVVVAGMILYPAVNALWLSVTSTNFLNIADQNFIGLANYEEIFTSGVFYTALGQSAIWTFGSVAVQLTLGMVGALILNSRIRARGVIRGLVLVPWATPSVLVALMAMWMLDPNLGIINRLLQDVGVLGEPKAFFADPSTVLPTLMVVNIWAGVPFFAVMILAALQGVPLELLEAAKIDGANAWQSFWRVTVPMISSTLMITTILRLIWTANYFDLMLILTNGGPANASLTLPLLAYQTAYNGFEFGKAAAVGTVQAAIMACFIVVYIRQVKKSEIA